MDDFEREQRKILKLGDKIRHDRSINKWEKHRRYVDILKNFLERYISSSFQLVEYSHIEGFPEKKFHLIMVKKDAKPKTCERTLCYGLELVAAVIEIRGSSLVNYKDKLEEDVKTKQTLREKIAGSRRNIKWLYLTLQEREKTKGMYACNYVQLCKKYLGQDFFYLRESTIQKTIFGEWKRFVKALLDP